MSRARHPRVPPPPDFSRPTRGENNVHYKCKDVTTRATRKPFMPFLRRGQCIGIIVSIYLFVDFNAYERWRRAPIEFRIESSFDFGSERNCLFFSLGNLLSFLLCWNNKENHDESESLLHDDGEYDLNIYTEYSKFEYSLNLESLKLPTTLELMQRV